MSGSRRWFNYESDNGVNYAVELDESNAESNIGGIRLCGDLQAGTPLFPGRAKKRYVNTISTADPNVRRIFWIGEPTVFNALVEGDAIADGAVTYSILSKRGEQFTFPNPVDSLQLDGDTPN